MPKRRLPLSVPNLVIVPVALAGAVVTLLLQFYLGAILLAVVGIATLAFAIAARRPDSSDRLRLNSLEYRDERDRSLARFGFAAVGAVALALAVVEVVVGTIIFSVNRHQSWAFWLYQFTFWQFFILGFIWSRVNRAAVEES